MIGMRKEFLDKEKSKFLDQMLLDQGNFKFVIDKLEKRINTFSTFINLDDHEECA